MAASGRLDGDLEGRLACIALLLSYKANMELPDKVLLLATTSGAMLAPSQHLSDDADMEPLQTCLSIHTCCAWLCQGTMVAWGCRPLSRNSTDGCWLQ